MKFATGRKAALLLGACALSFSALAVTVSDVKLDDQASVGGKNLVLNGAGLRTKFGLASVYVAALYLPQKSASAEQVIQAQEPRRILLTMKRDVDSDTMVQAFHEGVANNLGPSELKALKPKLDQLDQSFASVKQLKEGDKIAIDFASDGSTRVTYNGQAKDAIPGQDLSVALLKIWLGKKPVQDDLKDELLGKSS